MPIPSGQPEQHHRVLLRDMVRERIRDAIMDGTLQPGEDLRDEDLQSWLGVSRTPIRDAINELTRMGLIEMAPNRYTRVASPTEEEMLTAYQTLGVLFGGVVRLAVPNLSDEVKAELSAEFEFLLDAIEKKDWEEGRKHFIPLFERYLPYCENPQLAAVCRDSVDGLAYKVRNEKSRTLIQADRFSADLRALRDATMAGEAVAAELAIESAFLLPDGRAA
jgi:DNA-binding GntR family transcriptional regulator